MEACSRRHSVIPWEGYGVRVHDDAATAFKLIRLAADKDVSASGKAAIAAALLFVDPEGVRKAVHDLSGLLEEALWQVARIGDRESGGERVMDWEDDDAYIRASVWQAYGVSFDELCERTSFPELAKLVGMCPHETPIGQALYYRTAKPPKATKHNQEERRLFAERKRFWALGSKPGSDGGRAMDQAMTDAGKSLANMVRRSQGVR